MKYSSPARPALFAAAAVLAATSAAPRVALAQSTPNTADPTHIVSPSDLQQAASEASSSREQNQQTLQQFFSTPQADQALKNAHIDPQQVRTAINGLSDADMARFAARAHQAQSDFAGGFIGTHTLLLVLVGIAVLILIIVLV